MPEIVIVMVWANGQEITNGTNYPLMPIQTNDGVNDG
jgi:hypothetical protein